METTGDGASALEKITAPPPPNIAILNWNMPGLQGPQVCSRVRATESETYTYLILLTGNTDTEHIAHGLNSGADDYITKPFEHAELFARLKAGRRTVELQRALRRRISDLQGALSHIRTLQGLLPICCHCKKIRDDQGYWNQFEQYITQNTGADFTHGICPECLKIHYPKVHARRQQRLHEDPPE